MKKDCFKAIKEQYPEADEKLIRKALKTMEAEMEAYMADRSAPSRAEFVRLAAERMNEMLREAMMRKRETIVNLMAIQRGVDMAMSPAFAKDPAKALTAMMEFGEARLSAGGNVSVDGLKSARARVWHSTLATAIEKSGVGWEAVRTPVMDKSLAIEIAAIGGDTRYQPGQSTNQSARKLAETISKINRDIFNTLKDYGSPIEELVGRIIRQSHNPMKMMSVGESVWVKEMMDRLDLEHTFKGTDPADYVKELGDEYKRITGAQTNKDIESGNLTALGLGDIGERTAQARKFRFKTPDDWVEYNNKFGNGPLLQSFYREISARSRDIAIMHHFGTKPDATYTRIKRSIKAKLQNEGKEELLQKFNAAEPKLNKEYLTMRGVSDAPARSKSGKAAEGIKAWNTSRLLGGATITAIPSDFVNTAFRLSTTSGKNFFGQMASTITDWAGTIVNLDDRTAALKELQTIMNEFIGMQHGDMGIPDKPGMMTQAAALLWKATGMERQTATMLEVMGRRTQRILGGFADKDFSQLPQTAQNNLKRFGLHEPAKWELARLGVSVEDGSRVMSGEAIAEVPIEKVKELAAKAGIVGEGPAYDMAVARFHREVETGVLALVQDNIALGTTTPGNRQKSLLLQATTADEPFGIFLRLMTQFMSTPMMLLNETVRHTMTAGGKDSFLRSVATPSGFVALGERIAALTAAGYVSYTLAELIDGKTPPDPLDPATGFKSFTRGGAAGIYGDLLFAAFEQDYRKTMPTRLAGPAYGAVMDVGNIWNKALSGEDISSNMMEVGIRSLPFNNLWYTRAVLDQLLIQRFREWASPGYSSKEEAKASERGQTYWSDMLRPTEALGVR